MDNLENSFFRLNRYIAMCGICSRRDADKLIAAGIVCVNGENAAPGMKVTSSDIVSISGREIHPADNNTIIAYNKPAGVVCTERDVHAKRTITGELSLPVRVTYAGRLDKESEGLMILTDDGSLINQMMRAANGHEKQYEVTVDRNISDAFINSMRNGIWLEELGQKTRKCQVIRKDTYSFTIILTQGLNRQIRRMCAACGYNVVRLVRSRIMNIRLGDLPTGEYRRIEGAERQELYKECMDDPE